MSAELRIVFFGDVVGRPGRQALRKFLPKVREEFKPDVVVVNVENLAHGKGVTEKTLQELVNLNIDAFTAGEHIYDKANPAEVAALFEKFPNLIKPANYKPELPGRGEFILETPKGKVLIINLIGQVFIRHDNLSPWEMLPEILERHQDKDLVASLLDFHAEATSEKVALARHFDGQLSAIFGTHTHIPTADATIFPQGTAYVTDVGMNGPYDSVLGMKSEVSINRFLTGEKIAYDIAEGGRLWLNYIEVTIDPSSQKAVKIEHKHEIIQND